MENSPPESSLLFGSILGVLSFRSILAGPERKGSRLTKAEGRRQCKNRFVNIDNSYQRAISKQSSFKILRTYGIPALGQGAKTSVNQAEKNYCSLLTLDISPETDAEW